MFNIGGGEFVVIALIALIVLGPQRLPDAARQVGKVMGDLRRLSSGFQNEVRDALAEPTTTISSQPKPVAPAATSAVTSAVTSVSKHAPARRAPLQAAPARDSASGPPTSSAASPPARTKTPAKKTPAKKTPANARQPAKKTSAKARQSAKGGALKKAAPVPKGGRPRSKGS